MTPIQLNEMVTLENFTETSYLASNPDVARAVALGLFRSGRQHFELYGHKEGRRAVIEQSPALTTMRARKLARVEPILDLAMPHVRRGGKYDFLTEALRASTGITDTTNVGTNLYSTDVQALIARHPNGLILDCGAGFRQFYYENIVNYEIVDYASTDIIGVGEKLPFKDNSFDAVISMAVLEHVRDPFAAATEIVRVLKPGGELACSVPFLQPLHGFPHHYYNMTGQGLRALFERSLIIDDHRVSPTTHPIWSLTWILRSWAKGLPPDARAQFEQQRIGDLLGRPSDYVDRPWVRELSEEACWELAAGTFLLAHKPGK